VPRIYPERALVSRAGYWANAWFVVAYILFAVAGVCIIAGASIHYGMDTWNVLDIVQKWDSLFASFFAVLVILMTTISTNATGNIIPAGYQIAAIAPPN
jgi:allantoin permease